MKHSLFILFVFVLIVDVHATSLFVSSSTGKDMNLGTSGAFALKTIKKAKTIKADTIYLKAGDTFYESLGQIRNVVVTRYGEGNNPLLCGFKHVEKPTWKKINDNVWRINLTEIIYNGKGAPVSSIQNNIGCIYEVDTDQLHGRKVQYRGEMGEDWDMWQTEKFDKNVSEAEFDYLYLYLRINPNNLNLSFSIYDHVADIKDSTIDGIDMKGFGFGIAARSNSIIRNCNIDIIGGRTQIGAPSFVCYGNGIEFYVLEDIENCIVEFNTISRCYDCGVTIQGSKRGKATPRNIQIRNNLINNCCQGWEDFLRNDKHVMFENCTFERNIVVNSGDSGFGYPQSRFKYCHVLGNNKDGDRGMIIRNNIFVGGNYYCSGAYDGKYMSNKWYGNVCYIQRGDFLLSNYTGSKDVIRIPTSKGKYSSLNEATNAAIADYRKLTGDKTTRFVICSSVEVRKKAKKLVNKYKQKDK